MSSEANYQFPDFARHWARELGTSEKSLVQLQGGINNRVFSCGEGTNKWVIKGYSPLELNQRDRMKAEVDFLRYSAQVAPTFTPELIHADPELRCVILEYLEGKSFPEAVPLPQKAVDIAVEFFRRLNAEPETARQAIHMDAAEGFLSITEHLNNVDQRLGGMECNHLPAEARPEAVRLLAILRSELERVREITFSRISSGEVDDSIRPESRCVSPSDFGFHNAIQTSTSVRFFDFEFAGWDDPIKTSLDFILQPRMHINCRISPLLIPLTTCRTKHLNRRIALLAPILSLKWICIILAIFRPERLRQIQSVVPEVQRNTIVEERMTTASIYIDRYKGTSKKELFPNFSCS